MRPDKLEGVFVLDGAMATELERRGADLDHTLWSARVLNDQPALIEAVHYDYLVAGADVATTAGYQATFAGFERHGIDARGARDLLQLSVRLACDARDRFWSAQANRSGRRAPLVAASVGPWGAHLHDGSEYTGDYNVAERTLMDFHRRQLDVLAATQADLIAFETVPRLSEAEVLLRVLEEYPGLGAWISFSCRSGIEVSHGESFRECVATVTGSPQVLAAGVNCSAPEFVMSLLIEAQPVARKPLLAYPNTGERWQPGSNTWLGDVGLDDIGAQAARWRAAGASLIGGCCRTTPAHIGAIARSIHAA
jgi:homocysteine S-methyltransferase